MAMLKTQKKARYHGTATVEAALLFPLLLLLTLGVIEYGWLFLKAQQTTNAARHAVRLAIRPDATNQDVIDAIDSLMAAAGMGGSGYVVTILPVDDVSLPAVGDAITIEVTVPCASIVIMDVPLLLPTPTSLHASVTMAKEGPSRTN